jgi:proliferating cell nuclear antigen
MFKMVLKDAELLKKSIPIIAEIIDEGTFRVDANGLSLLSPDRTMVAVVDFTIPSSAFEEFHADGPEDVGLNMSSLVDVVKRIKSTDRVVMQSGKDGRLSINLEGNGLRKFKLSMLDIKADNPPIDKLKFSGRVVMKSEVLEEGIADADIIADSLVMQTAPDTFRISTKGDTSSAELELKKGQEGLIEFHAPENLRSRYPLEYLKKMIKAAKISDKTVLEFGTDYPMRLSFVDTDRISLRFILAPRVED